MRVSLNFIVRIAGMLLCAVFGNSVGQTLSSASPDSMEVLATQLLTLAGAGLGLIVTPLVTIDPVRELIGRMRETPLSETLLIMAGGFIGLLFGAILTVPLSMLPRPLGQFAPLLAAITLAYIGATVFAVRKREIIDQLKLWSKLAPGLPTAALDTVETPQLPAAPPTYRYLLDTSAIIDGRIASVARTGFMEGVLMVPGFVLTELQTLADASDELRRSKGRRGLELLSDMQKNSPLPIEIMNVEVNGANRVDDKLVILARQFSYPIITNDFNLNRVAGLQGIKVLSLNQLSESVRPPVIQDQHLQVLIRNEGNVRQQGVGYLEDGTPVIVEDARHLIGQVIDVVVTRLLQTQSGRMIFAHLSSDLAARSETER